MTLGHTPTRERVVLPRREGVPLYFDLDAGTSLADAEAYLYFYNARDEEIAFWPVSINGSTITVDIEDWWPLKDEVRSYTVFVVYDSAPTKYWPAFEGAVVRTY